MIIKTQIKSNCVVCSSEFEPKTRDSKYCGSVCRSKASWRKRNPLIKNCKTCDKPLEHNNQKYCSDKCKKERLTKICIGCGVEFKTDQTTQTYCNASCSRGCNIIKSNLDKGRETQRQNFLTKFIENLQKLENGRFEYVEGYVNNISQVTLKCTICGENVIKNASFLRKTHEASCPNCDEIKRIENEKKFQEEEKIRKRLLSKQRLNKKAETKRLRELEREGRTVTKECVHCGDVFRTTSKVTITCSKECGKKYNDKKKEYIRRNRIKNNGNVDYGISLPKLVKRDKSICALCGEKIDYKDYTVTTEGYFLAGPNYPSVDHIVPLSLMGEHTWENIQLAHYHCNSVKGNDARSYKRKMKKIMEDKGIAAI